MQIKEKCIREFFPPTSQENNLKTLLKGTPEQTTEQYTSPEEMQFYYFKEKHPLEDGIFSPQGYI